MSTLTVPSPTLGVKPFDRNFEFRLYEKSKNAPTLGGVYAIFERERLSYIGQTSNFRKRFYSHQASGQFIWESQIIFIPVPSKAIRLIMEEWLITKHQPLENRRMRDWSQERPHISIRQWQHWSYDPRSATLNLNQDDCDCGCNNYRNIHVPTLTKEQSDTLWSWLWNHHEGAAIFFQEALDELRPDLKEVA